MAREMLLPIVFLPLAAVLQVSLAQGEKSFVLGLSKQQQQEIVDAYNAARRAVQPTASNMLKMEWSERAAESAKRWAAECQGRASLLKNRYVDDILCGESISQSNFARSWAEVIGFWNSSHSKFIYGKSMTEELWRKVLPYTQMVWYNSNEIGCAYAFCPLQETFTHFYVCRFCPTGNILEMLPKPYKEGPTCGDCPNNCDNKLCTNPCKYKNEYSAEQCAETLNNFGCETDFVQKKCKASCDCKTEIV
ncbi:cysteine-rich venom protein TEL1-like [Sceloporus undulatus]|uniref:cysteine-rich venom protein TEL1-like n=1 Tax=Sceloporus undulatus TaxID=8520 RepID=UPI001C4DD768|nr:cysteine-rich venom protein TEL1-like [Sceloporus undulatus]